MHKLKINSVYIYTIVRVCVHTGMLIYGTFINFNIMKTQKPLSRSSANAQQLNNATNQFDAEFIDLENELNPKRAKDVLESDLQLLPDVRQPTHLHGKYALHVPHIINRLLDTEL